MGDESDITYLLWLKVVFRKRKAKTMSGDEDDSGIYICRRDIIRTLRHFLVEISHVKMQCFMRFDCVIEGLSFASSVTLSSSCSIPSIYTFISFSYKFTRNIPIQVDQVYDRALPRLSTVVNIMWFKQSCIRSVHRSAISEANTCDRSAHSFN
jgi:hypothetical protein